MLLAGEGNAPVALVAEVDDGDTAGDADYGPTEDAGRDATGDAPHRSTEYDLSAPDYDARSDADADFTADADADARTDADVDAAPESGGGEPDGASTETDADIALSDVPLGGSCFQDEHCAPGSMAFVPHHCLEGTCTEANFVPVAVGAFTMGCPESADCRPDTEGTQETAVTLSRSVYAQRFEVTQSEYYALTGDVPSGHETCDPTTELCLLPVENVTWFDALRFANLLSDEAGLERCYTLSDCRTSGGKWTCSHLEFEGFDCFGYRLPTEAEWEFLARAGTTSDLYCGDVGFGEDVCNDGAPDHIDDSAWWCGNAGSRTHPVGTLQPNDFGLFDMAGNVAEWTFSAHEPYPDGPLTDPWMDPRDDDGWLELTTRGGDYRSTPTRLQHGSRHHEPVDHQHEHTGFRLVRTMPPAE